MQPKLQADPSKKLLVAYILELTDRGNEIYTSELKDARALVTIKKTGRKDVVPPDLEPVEDAIESLYPIVRFVFGGADHFQGVVYGETVQELLVALYGKKKYRVEDALKFLF